MRRRRTQCGRYEAQGHASTWGSANVGVVVNLQHHVCASTSELQSWPAEEKKECLAGCAYILCVLLAFHEGAVQGSAFRMAASVTVHVSILCVSSVLVCMCLCHTHSALATGWTCKGGSSSRVHWPGTETPRSPGAPSWAPAATQGESPQALELPETTTTCNTPQYGGSRYSMIKIFSDLPEKKKKKYLKKKICEKNKWIYFKNI